MQCLVLLLLAARLLGTSYSKPVSSRTELQRPLVDQAVSHPQPNSQRLHGRFLHISDPFYKVHASTEEDDACHRGKGTSGTYGAETSDCDTPFALINATFKWIEENLKDNIDFVVWTGDSARHDSDEKIPRNADEVLATNKWIANKFAKVFREEDSARASSSLTIPIIPTFGNNDILPHNILTSGPNQWLKAYTNTWSKFIPEEQRHGFERGGWFYVEVIPQKLAVFSLNTLYFFTNNAAVDGCALRSEPGYEHMEWLRIQLQFMRQRGMKAILTGHVPPARTTSKQLWDETCWQKYTLWLRQYRDVVIAGLYGHMNIDHFMLQDAKDVDILLTEDELPTKQIIRATMDEELSIESANDYLQELREDWSDLPNPKLAVRAQDDSERLDRASKKGKKEKRRKKILKELGGPWAEQFQVSHVGPSIVPNFFPTLRVIEYNITTLDGRAVWANPQSWAAVTDPQLDWLDGDTGTVLDYHGNDGDSKAIGEDSMAQSDKKKEEKGKKGKKKPHKPDFVVPSPPSKTAPPGPGYSPQTLTLLGYTQYFANLTHINNYDFVTPDDAQDVEDNASTGSWHEGKHKGKLPKDNAPHPRTFQFQVEYSTFTDAIYRLEDMTVKSYLRLAHRIGQYKPEDNNRIDAPLPQDLGRADDKDIGASYYIDDNNNADSHRKVGEHGRKRREKKRHRQHKKNKVWLRFIQRAFVGTLNEEDLRSFEQSPELELKLPRLPPSERSWIEPHDGEL